MRRKIALPIGILCLLFLAFGLVTNNLSMRSAIESCEQANGEAKVDKEWFGINWNVSCENNKGVEGVGEYED